MHAVRRSRGRTSLRPLLVAVLALLALAPVALADQRFSPDRVIVKFAAGTPAAERSAAIERSGGTRVDGIRPLGLDVARSAGRAGDLAERLRRRPDVLWAERDGVLEPDDVVQNDFYWYGAWGLTKTGTSRAWDATEGSPSVVIAILDSGVDAANPDLRDRLVGGYDFQNGDADPADDNGHGTGAAGVAAATASNGVGVAGYCPGCSIMPVKIADAGAYSLWSVMAKGIAYAADHGARVINMSYSGSSSSAALSDAVTYAAGKGAVLVASAGNDGVTTPMYPAAHPAVVSVAATDQLDGLTSYSNRGAGWVELAAPGCNYSARLTTATSPYGTYCGTSSAAPAVAGIAGLLASVAPSAGAAAIEQALRSGAVPVTDVAHGRVDAAAAVAAIGGALAAPADPAGAAPPAVLAANGTPAPAALDAGVTVGASPGRWTGTVTSLAYQWLRCAADGSACAPIAGATTRTYRTLTDDLGRAIRVQVTAGGASATSSAVALKAAAPAPEPAPVAAPASTGAPAVSGTAQEGSVLSTSTGTWSGSPASYAYQWQRCDAAGACAPIAGATAPSYTATAADVGSALRAAVTATNAGGSTTALSAATATVAAKPPALTTTEWLGSLSAKVPSQSFGAAMGAGSVSATLTFSKVSQLTLKLVDGTGATVATVTGPSGVRLGATVPAGTYRYVVSGTISGKGGASFTLRSTHAAP